MPWPPRGQLRFVTVVLDGVTYAYGHREPVHVVEATAHEPTRAGAEAALREVLGRLEGLDQRIRAGFAAVRFGEAATGRPAAWTGPGHLFSLEARTAGAFEVTWTGEDPDAFGPPPDVEVEEP